MKTLFLWLSDSFTHCLTHLIKKERGKGFNWVEKVEQSWTDTHTQKDDSIIQFDELTRSLPGPVCHYTLLSFIIICLSSISSTLLQSWTVLQSESVRMCVCVRESEHVCVCIPAAVMYGSLHAPETRQARRLFKLNVLIHWRVKRSEEHTSELQSLEKRSYAVFCLEKKNRVH